MPSVFHDPTLRVTSPQDPPPDSSNSTDTVARAIAAGVHLRYTKPLAATAELVLHRHKWVHRRVDSLELAENATLIHRVSLDFTVPHTSAEVATAAPAASANEGTVYFPVTLLRKARLTCVDLKDESGRTLPMLGRDESATVTLVLIKAIATQQLTKLNVRSSQLPTSLIDDLWYIIASDPNHLSSEFAHRPSDETPQLCARYLFHTPPSVADPPDDRSLPEWLSNRLEERSEEERELRRKLGDHSSFLVALVSQLTTHHIVYAFLENASLGSRRIVKFSRVMPLRMVDPSAVLPDYPAVSSPQGFLDFLLSSLGWRTTVLAFGVQGSLFAASYHLQIAAPKGLELYSAELRRVTRKRAGSSSKRLGLRRRLTRDLGGTVVDRVHLPGELAHLYARFDIAQRGIDQFVAVLRLRLRYSAGWRAHATALSMVNFLAVWLVYVRLRGLMPASSEAVAAVLIAFTGLSVAYLGRPFPHRMTSDFLAGTRFALILSGGASLAAVGLVVLGPPQGGSLAEVRVWWQVVVGTSGVGAGVLLLSYLFSLPSRRILNGVLGWLGQLFPHNHERS